MTFDPNNPDSEDFDPFRELFEDDPVTDEQSAPSEDTADADSPHSNMQEGDSSAPGIPVEDLPTVAMSSADVAKVQWDMPETTALPETGADSDQNINTDASRSPFGVTVPTRARTEVASKAATTSASTAATAEAPQYFWQKIQPLVWVAIVIAVILLASVSFLVGQQVGALQAIPDEPEPTETAPPIPDDEPVPPGAYRWTELHGGECIAYFNNPWQENFVVADCNTPHDAQLVRADSLSSSSFWPEEAAYLRDLPELCQAAEVLDLSIAEHYPDLQLSFSYPTSQEAYRNIENRYFCFINRESNEPLIESLMPKSLVEEPVIDPSADPNE